MKKIINKCKCSISLGINKHRDYYETAEQYVNNINGRNDREEIEDELKYRMIDTDTIYELQFYPDTPVGFYVVYGTSLDEVINKAKECLKNN